ncbi:AAA family ATPase [Acinetobacter haemolyticus]|uniref:AAA family ATPase n=1 Tax=Acinetobacter haemolyticus TaxID=29430 RepID=UPI003C1C28AA
MKNLKISKLKISNFKAFSNIEFFFDNSSLITLEGPNGYGKTTVFDALELLFTGSIKRINRLSDDVMGKKQTNFKDNLYWNKKKGEHPIEIRIELFDSSTNSYFYFCRRAEVDDLKVEQNNKANNFSIFKLYKLETFDSMVFKNELNNTEIDEYLGENFLSNYTVTNYLEQGQSTFIFSTSTLDRKNYISKLMNIENLNNKIKLCGSASLKIGSEIGEDFKKRKSYLETEIELRKNNEVNDNNNIIYKKLSTHDITPSWDMESPNCFRSFEEFKLQENEINTLHSIYSEINEFNLRVKNNKINSFLSKYKESLFDAIHFGKHINDYEILKSNKITYLGCETILKILHKDIVKLKTSNLLKFESLHPVLYKEIDKRLYEQIAKIQVISDSLYSVNKELLDINNARNKLLDHQEKDESSTSCVFCGYDWNSHEALINAVNFQYEHLNKESLNLTNQLSNLEKETKIIIDYEIIKFTNLKENTYYNKELLDTLEIKKNEFETIQKVVSQIDKMDLEIPKDFTNDKDELDLRLDIIRQSILAFRQNENPNFPSNWLEVINKVFKNTNEYNSINLLDIQAKKIYFSKKWSESNNIFLIELQKELEEMKTKEIVCKKIQKNLKDLKKHLTDLNNDYSRKIINDIELIFHIYSGRLIQNYQRGLGLFIDEGGGDRLRFSTAEKSEHDATLAMSSGQLSALSLAFFLALNAVYAKTSLVLIDDPAQSLDEINIASLSDLLRCELKHRQLFLSSHEDDISTYLRYRFKRVGLSQKSFHMQKYLLPKLENIG